VNCIAARLALRYKLYSKNSNQISAGPISAGPYWGITFELSAIQ